MSQSMVTRTLTYNYITGCLNSIMCDTYNDLVMKLKIIIIAACIGCYDVSWQ